MSDAHFVYAYTGADPENCFGRGTLDCDEARRRRRGGEVWGEDHLPTPLESLGERCKPQLQTISGRYIRNFVRFHACCSVFWNLTGNTEKIVRRYSLTGGFLAQFVPDRLVV